MKLAVKQHYHWVIAAVVLLVMFVYIGILNNIVGLYLVPVSEALGISRSGFSLAFSVRSLVGACAVVFSGPVIRKYGYRRLATIGLLVASAAFLNMAMCQNVVMLYVTTILIGVCDGLCSTAAAVFLIGKWFHRYHGSILGLATAFTGIGGSACCMLITGVIERFDWRTSLVLCAGMTAVLSLVVAVFVRNEPEDLKLAPLGEGELVSSAKQKKDRDHWQGYRFQTLLRMPNFYLAMLGVLLTNLCLCLTYYNLVPYLQDCGMTTAQAAAMQSVMLLVMAGFKLLCGVFTDLFGAKWVTGICLVALIISMMLFTAISGVASAWAAVTIFSLALPMMSVTIPLLTASLFGYSAHDSISGIFLALPSVAAVIASPIANLVYDRVGTYRPAFIVAAVGSVFIFALHIIIFILANRNRKQIEWEIIK